MDALLFPRKEVRYVAAMAASRLKPGAGASVGPLKLTQVEPPELPGKGWEHVTTRLAGTSEEYHIARKEGHRVHTSKDINYIIRLCTERN
mgnify:CR=1 FL=1